MENHVPEKSTLQRLVSGSVLRLTSLLINIVVAFLMMPFIIEHLGDRWYGLWVIVGSLIGFYGYLDFGLSSASQRFIAKAIHSKEDDVNKVASTAIYLFACLSFVTLLVTAAITLSAPYFVENEHEQLTFQLVILILGVKSAVMFPFLVFNGFINAYLRYDIDTYITIAKLILRTLLIVVYLTLGYSIIALAIITLLTETLGYIAIAFWAKKIHPSLSLSMGKRDKELVPHFFNYSKNTFVASLGDILRFKIDNLIIAKYLGLSMVTHYAIAIRLIDYVGQFLNAALGVFLPIFTKYDAQGKDEEMREKFLIVTEISVFLTLLTIPPLMIAGKVFIGLWMGEEYSGSYFPLLILAIASILAGCNRVCITALYAKAQHSYYAKVNLIEGLINLLLSILLVQEFGVLGVALGTTIATVYVKAVLLPRYTCNALRLNVFIYYKVLIKHLVLAITYYAFVFWGFSGLNVDRYAGLLIFLAIASLVYLGLSVLVFSKPLKRELVKLVPRKVLSVMRNS
jgi:O-antigen/teichoic acid export membrane protein